MVYTNIMVGAGAANKYNGECTEKESLEEQFAVMSGV